MRTIYRLLIGIALLAAMFTLPAWHKRSPRQQSVAPPASGATKPVIATQPSQIHYVRCDEARADLILKATVIVRAVVDQEFIIPLRRERRYDDNGSLQMTSGPGATMICADGVKDGHGIGYVGSVDLDEATDHDVTLHVFFAWTAPHRAQGKVDCILTIPVGQAFEQKLSALASIRAIYQPSPRLERQRPGR